MRVCDTKNGLSKCLKDTGNLIYRILSELVIRAKSFLSCTPSSPCSELALLLVLSFLIGKVRGTFSQKFIVSFSQGEVRTELIRNENKNNFTSLELVRCVKTRCGT